MTWINTKTNWSSSDYYNFGDLNRVENNTNEVADVIGSYTTRPVLETVVTDRDNTRIEFYDDLNRIERNIDTLRNATYTPVGFIDPKTDWVTLDIFDYNDANRLELNILALYTLVSNVKNYFQYSGTFYCGQDNATL